MAVPQKESPTVSGWARGSQHAAHVHQWV